LFYLLNFCCEFTRFHKVIFEENKSFTWGLVVNLNDPWRKWKVFEVHSGKQAEALKIKKGWKIISVNNEKLNQDNYESIKNILMKGLKVEIIFGIPKVIICFL
jgi:hypothetical protein